MKILVDTHILLWVLNNDKQISANQKKNLQNHEHEKWISQISFMELAIKLSLGKVAVRNSSLAEIINSAQYDGFQILPLKNEHIANYNNIRLIDSHKDPFDRFLIAIATAENMHFMTSDEKFRLYGNSLNLLT